MVKKIPLTFIPLLKTWSFGPGQRRLALPETVGKGIQESEFRIQNNGFAFGSVKKKIKL
jgi:hypothetical protein